MGAQSAILCLPLSPSGDTAWISKFDVRGGASTETLAPEVVEGTARGLARENYPV